MRRIDMKAYKHTIAAAGLCAVLGLFPACSDFLEEDPKGQMTNLSAFTERADLEGSINALYYQIKMATMYISDATPVIAGDDLTSIISKDNTIMSLGRNLFLNICLNSFSIRNFNISHRHQLKRFLNFLRLKTINTTAIHKRIKVSFHT